MSEIINDAIKLFDKCQVLAGCITSTGYVSITYLYLKKYLVGAYPVMVLTGFVSGIY